MSNLRDALFNAGKNATCQVINSPTLGASAGLGLGAEAGAILLGPQIGYIYCDQPAITPPPAPPFTGGQCPGKYRVNYTARVPTGVQGGTNCVGVNVVNAFGDFWGPIGGITDRQPGCTTGDEGPAPFKGLLCHGFTNTARQTNQVEVSIIGRAYSASITSVVPLESNPDNCGDPDPVIPPYPPGGVTNNYDITYETNEGNILTLSVPITVFKPYVDFSGNFSVPLSFNLGGVNFNGDLKPFGDPEFTLNFPTTGGPGSTDGDEPPNDPDPTDPVEPPSEESPATIIGVEVFSQVSADVEASSIIFNNAPNIFAPRLGSVAFAIRTPSSLVWTGDINIKNVETYIPCPAPQGAVAVRATPAPGVTVRWNAIRSKPLLQI